MGVLKFLAPFALLGPLVVLLLMPGAADRRRPLADPESKIDVRSTREQRPLAFRSAEVSPGTWRFDVDLVSPEPAKLCAAGGVSFKLGTHFQQLTSTEVLLQSADGLCGFEARGLTVSDNAMVDVARRVGATTTAETRWTLTVTAQNAEKGLALWSVAGAWAEGLLCTSNADTRCRDPIFGETLPAETGRGDLSRAALLAHTWGFNGTLPIWIVLGLAGVLVAGAAQLWREHPAWSAAAAVFALGASYVIVIPPFQTPDEPDHLISSLAYAGHAAREPDVLALAQRGHFERLKYRVHERITAKDLVPVEVPWNSEILAPPAELRSGFPSFLIRPWSGLLASLPMGQALLLLRLANVTLSSLCVLLGCLLLGRGQPPSAASFGAAAFLTVPTLPFFAMHVSNYAWFTTLAMLSGLCLARALRTRPEFSTLLVSGVAFGLLAVSSSSGLAAAPFFVFALGTLVALDASATRTLLHSLVLGGAFGATLAALGTGLAGDTLQRLTTARPTLAPFATAHWFAAALTAALLLYVNLLALLRRRTASTRLIAWLTPRRLAIATALPILILAARSTLRTIAPHPDPALLLDLSKTAYATLALKKFAAALAWGQPEFYLSQSFWGGFGWLETLPRPELAMALRCLALCGILSWLFTAVWRPATDERRAIVAFLGTALCAGGAIFISAIGTWTWPDALHGRYMIAIYACLLTLAYWAGERATSRLPEKAAMATRVTICAAIPLAVHAYTLTFLTQRYF